MENTIASGSSSSMVERPLFGGAITCQIPAHWRDVSEVRQVPDNQECWHDVTSSDGGSALLVVEILELQPVAAHEAANYFFTDLAESNGCTDPANTSFRADEPVAVASPPPPNSGTGLIVVPPGLPADAVLCGGSGFQLVAMGRETDIAAGNAQQRLASRNEIRRVNIQLAVIRLPRQATDLLVTLTTPAVSTDHDNEDNQHQAELFRQILSKLQIRDWSLFG